MAPTKNESKKAKATRQATHFTSSLMKAPYPSVVKVLAERSDILVEVCDFVESRGSCRE